MGYYLAGFRVVGVDNRPQKRYPFEFHQADAMAYPLDGFDAYHASPPCQKFSVASIRHIKAGKVYPDCLTPIRERFRQNGKPWIIENVLGAPMSRMIILCGLMFDLKVFRHRAFETSFVVFSPEHPSHKGKKIGEGYFSVAGGSGRWKSWGTVKRNVSKGTIKEWQAAMGIDWMTAKEIREAIPPTYTEWIGQQLMEIMYGH
jgi:DNA (cytosine-5)-methyltransferase 1